MRSPEWAQVDRLVEEQKYEAAYGLLRGLRDRLVIDPVQEGEASEALVKMAQLRVALQAYAEAIFLLEQEPWPSGFRWRALLSLYCCEVRKRYLNAYSWEIANRTPLVSAERIPLEKRTAEQIVSEALASLERLWVVRAELDQAKVEELGDSVARGTYPPGLRDSLRDLLTYQAIDVLANTRYWRPEQSKDVYRLGLGKLLGPEPAGRSFALNDGSVHPLQRACSALDDLESWHRRGARAEAALEARLERVRLLQKHFSEDGDRKELEAQLAGVISSSPATAWLACAYALLANLQKDRGDNVEARTTALLGCKSSPGSLGEAQCRAVVAAVEAPDFQLEGMHFDGPGRRTFRVRHKNLQRLYFRAVPLDLDSEVLTSKDYHLLPGHNTWRKKLSTKHSGVQEWSVDLANTPDYKTHSTYFSPPLRHTGLYVVQASVDPSFREKAGNRVVATNLLLSDLVLLTETTPLGLLRVLVVQGAQGQPVENVEVTLYRVDWQRSHEVVGTQRTNDSGEVEFGGLAQNQGYFVVARKGDQYTMDPSYRWLPSTTRQETVLDALLYTDRSVYRPEQPLHFKVVVYRGSPREAKFRIASNKTVTLTLRDPKGEVVQTLQVTTNEYGSASGTLELPAGRLLGRWTLACSTGAQTAVRVEEYKRPTFELTWKETTEALRLNEPACLRGEARYYFGLPVTGGVVRWTVEELPVYTGFLWWFEPPAKPRRVAVGETIVQEDGTFEVRFVPEVDPRKAAQKGLTFRYSVRAELTDAGGETRTSTQTLRLGFCAVEAAISTEKAFSLAGELAQVVVRRTNLQGAPAPGRGWWRLVQVEQPQVPGGPADYPFPPRLEDKESFSLPGDHYPARWQVADYRPERLLSTFAEGPELARGELLHDAQGEAAIALSGYAAGVYRVLYETTDDAGHRFETSQEILWVARTTPLGVPTFLRVESSSVRVGDRLKLVAASGTYDQLLALDLYERGERASRRWLKPGEDELFELEIREQHRGGFRVVLLAVRDYQLLRLESTVMVPWSDKELQLEWSTVRDKLRPGGQETWRVTVRDAAGELLRKRAAELLAYMYDRSLDAFAPHQFPKPLALYPEGTQAPLVRANLQGGGASVLLQDLLVQLPEVVRLLGDSLRFYESYGVGGPFGRFAVPGGPPVPCRCAAPAPRAGAPCAPAPGQTALGLPEPGALAERESDQAQGGSPQAGAPEEPPQIRSDFAETAFFLPHLTHDDNGSATLEFVVPDSVTSWNVWVHALSKDFRSASLQRQVRSLKELMVRPYLPRFFREDDEVQLRVVVNNAGEETLAGALTLALLDSETDQDLCAAFDVQLPTQGFEVRPGRATTLLYSLKVPRRLGNVTVRVLARTPGGSDGELRSLPILPSRSHLAQSRFAVLRDADQRTLQFDDLLANDDPTRINERLVVTLEAQLFVTVLKALPYLVEYPYECCEQLLNRFLSSSIVHRVYEEFPSVAALVRTLPKRETPLERWDAVDPNRRMALEETPWLGVARGGRSEYPLVDLLDPEILGQQRRIAIERLGRAQTASGGFPWFPGGPPSPYITLYLLEGMARGLEFGVELPTPLIQRAWEYLTRHFRTDILPRVRKAEIPAEVVAYLHYVLSAYREASLVAGAFTEHERSEMLDYVYANWKKQPPMLKSQIALSLHRAGRTDQARIVFASVLDAAKTDRDRGMYWAPEDRSWLWHSDTLEGHVQALLTMQELSPQDPSRHELVLWLLLDKKLNHWKSTRATAGVLYALVRHLRQEGTLGVQERARVHLGSETQEFVFEPEVYQGKAQLTIFGDSIDPAVHGSLRVDKETPGLLFASATWHFSTEQLPEQAHGDLLEVRRSYYRRDKQGDQTVLVPLAEGASLQVGDEVEVQLSVRSKHAAEYVHLRDPRPAGFEPEDVHSGYCWQEGPGHYREVRDSGTNFFFDWIPNGEFTLGYRLRASAAGTYRAQPATLQPLYAPEFTAYSSGARLRIGGSAEGLG